MNSIRLGKNKTFQVVDVTYKKNGQSIITPISEYMPIKINIPSGYIPSCKELVKGTQYENLEF